MPETGVQQVQHSMLDTAHIEVDAAWVLRTAISLRPSPVLLVGKVAERIMIFGINVAQLVPRRTSPLGHHVGVAAVHFRPITQIELHVDPVRGLRQRRLRGGVSVLRVEAHGLVVIDLGEFDRQHRIG